MATLTLRADKGSPLTNTELDTNFTNINTELGQKLSANGNLSYDEVTLTLNHASGTPSGTKFSTYSYNNVEIGSISQSGTTGVLFSTTSDRRLKDGIVTAPNSGNDIDSINVVSYNWGTEPKGALIKYGLIAQELVQILPEAVFVGDSGTDPEDIKLGWGIDYGRLVPILIKEVQMLRARVSNLESTR
jgi:hypothetical protein